MKRIKNLLKKLKDKMEFKKFIKYAMKTKRFTQRSIKEVSEMPLEKIVIGTTAMVLPGGIVISGVYVAAQELKQRYDLYVKTTNEQNEKPESFTSWLNENYAEYLKEKKDVVVDSVSDSVGTYGKKLKQYTVGKVSSFLKKKP